MYCRQMVVDEGRNSGGAECMYKKVYVGGAW